MDNAVLTYETLVKVWRDNQPIVRYATLDWIPRDTVYTFDNDKGAFSWFLCHPDDFLLIKQHFPAWRFVHLREAV
jgi:hypothetical protein